MKLSIRHSRTVHYECTVVLTQTTCRRHKVRGFKLTLVRSTPGIEMEGGGGGMVGMNRNLVCYLQHYKHWS